MLYANTSQQQHTPVSVYSRPGQYNVVFLQSMRFA